MNLNFPPILAGLFAAVCYAAAVSPVQAENKGRLDSRQEAIVPISAFAASGDLKELKQALNEGLEAGLTVNEIKEILIQLYAYAGFPRSLNAISAFMEVLDEREKKGIRNETGKAASALPATKSSLESGTEIQTRLVGHPVTGEIFTFAPAIDRFLRAHLFGDIFGRDVLDFQTREIATISVLSNMEGVNPQLLSHFKIAMNIGLTEMQLKRLVAVIDNKVGRKQAENASGLLAGVVGKERGKTNAQKIVVTHTAALAPTKGPEDQFTGSVRIDTPFQAHEPAHFFGANVIFEAGSRTAWHTHELGQLLIVTSGVGRIQRWGDPAQEIRKGDVVWIPPRQKHWHGAAPDSPMTHIAIVEEQNRPSTRWLEKVSDEQYEDKPE